MFVIFCILDTEYSVEGAVILNAVEAVFHGLYIIIPLMTAELLKVCSLFVSLYNLSIVV